MRFAAAIVALLLVASACSAESIVGSRFGNTDTSESEPSELSEQAQAEPALAFEPSRAFVAAVMERLRSGSNRFEIVLAFADDAEEQGFETSDSQPPDGPIVTGVTNNGWTSVHVDMSPALAGREIDDPSMYQIANDRDMYLYSPLQAGLFDDLPGFDESSNPMAGASKGWIYVNLDRLRSEGGELGLGDAMASHTINVEPLLEFMSGVEEGPPATIRGVATRSLNIEVDTEAMFAASTEDGGPDLSALGLFGNLTLQLFVDADGNVRRVVQGRSPMLQQVDFFDFGAGPPIDLPTEFDDVTDLVLDSASRFPAAASQAITTPEAVATTAPIPTPIPTPIPAPTPDAASTNFDSIGCLADPATGPAQSASYGQSGSPARIATLTEMENRDDCDRMVIEFQLGLGVREVHSHPLPELVITSDETSTQITFVDFVPLNMGDEQFTALSSDVVAFAAVGPAEPYVQILHEGHTVAATTLTEPPRLVIDFVPRSEAANPAAKPVAGRATILRGPISPDPNTPIRVGDQIRIEGWTLRFTQEEVPYYRVLTPRESVNEITPLGQAGFVSVPFLTAHGPLEQVVADGLFYWVEFELELDTSDWLAASHAVLIGSESSDGFVGTGQLFPVLDAAGQTRVDSGYLELPSQFLYHVNATSWVEQG